MKSIFRYDKHVNLIKTKIIRKKIKSSKIKIYKNLHCYINKKSQVVIKEGLELGCQWEHGKYFPSQFVMRKNSRMEVKGYFCIYTECNIWINENAELILGSGYINNGFNLSCFCKIEIGDNVAISENVTIRDSDNHYLDLNKPNSAPVKIGNNVWIGINSTILKGVTIGDGSVIGAGSVVNRDIPPRSLAAGVPARVKKTNVCWRNFASV